MKKDKWEDAKDNFPLKFGLGQFCTRVREQFLPAPQVHLLVPQNPPFRKSRRPRSKGYFPHGHRNRCLTIIFSLDGGKGECKYFNISNVHILISFSYSFELWVQMNALCLLHTDILVCKCMYIQTRVFKKKIERKNKYHL